MKMKQITPFVPCSDLENQISFFRDILGFKVGFQADNYAFLRCDQVAVRLIEVDQRVDLLAPERECSFYIDVDDIDALYAAMEPKLSSLPDGRVRSPFNQQYGQREFHVADEDCTLIFFGQAIA